MKTKIYIAFCFSLLSLFLKAQKNVAATYYQLKVYHFNTHNQQLIIDAYLHEAYIPYLHKKGITKVGVFTSVDNDTAQNKLMVVFVPYKSLEQMVAIQEAEQNSSLLQTRGAVYLQSTYNNPPYNRIETIILKSFINMPLPAVPTLTAAKTDRVYELRSYESSNELLHIAKVEMFNEGNEMEIFTRLQFNPIFYGKVIAGNRMPNLMYMTSFNNKADRDEHWKKFGEDAYWKKISVLPKYLNTVSKADITFLHPTSYSDF